jgi:hypothetical protein
MALTPAERTRRKRLKANGVELPPTPKQLRAAAIKAIMAEHNCSRATAYKIEANNGQRGNYPR